MHTLLYLIRTNVCLQTTVRRTQVGPKVLDQLRGLMAWLRA